MTVCSRSASWGRKSVLYIEPNPGEKRPSRVRVTGLSFCTNPRVYFYPTFVSRSIKAHWILQNCDSHKFTTQRIRGELCFSFLGPSQRSVNVSGVCSHEWLFTVRDISLKWYQSKSLWFDDVDYGYIYVWATDANRNNFYTLSWECNEEDVSTLHLEIRGLLLSGSGTGSDPLLHLVLSW